VSAINSGAAIVGVARTPYYRRGESDPQTQIELACKAIIGALDDAGLTVDDLDGFSYYTGGLDTALVAQILGIPEVTFTVTETGGGGGSAGSLGVAAAAIQAGLAKTVVCVRSMQQGKRRAGAAFAPSTPGASVAAESDFYLTSGLVGPGQMFAMLARRHMYLHKTQREDFAEIVLSQRQNAMTRPDALRKTPLTLEDYLASPLIADPLCRYDFCVENDVAGAVVLTSAERAADLRHPVVRVLASEHGGLGRWGQAETWFGMPDEYFASAGHASIAKRMYAKAGITPADVDVALIYDNFSSNVLLQLEDYGFADKGGGGELVRSGAIRWPTGRIPVNTHGGQLSEGFLAGMSHIIEGVEQLRGTAINQVADAQIALVTGGAAAIPTSGAVLSR
jgi:acetyl-CoA acetyltransferase